MYPRIPGFFLRNSYSQQMKSPIQLLEVNEVLKLPMMSAFVSNFDYCADDINFSLNVRIR